MANAPYLRPYRESAQRHGNSFAVTLWASQRSQETRFEVLAALCDLTGKRVLDAGCSRGDFAAFLIERGIAFEHYVGVDGLADIVSFAASRKLPRCDFLCGDLLAQPRLWSRGDPDVVVISGTLNTMSDSQVMTMLESGWRVAREALVFNFLPNHARLKVKDRPGPARRLDPIKIMAWALARTTLVVYKQDYFPSGHDATVFMGKE